MQCMQSVWDLQGFVHVCVHKAVARKKKCLGVGGQHAYCVSVHYHFCKVTSNLTVMVIAILVEVLEWN